MTFTIVIAMQNTITDNEGSADTLEIVDSSGKDSYKLYVTEDSSFEKVSRDVKIS